MEEIKIPTNFFFCNPKPENNSILWVGCSGETCKLCKAGYKYFEYGKHCLRYLECISECIDADIEKINVD